MSRFTRMRRTKSQPATERSLLDWAALSLLTEHPKPTGNQSLDNWNDAIACVQSYLNGRAVAAETDEEKAYLLRLRADLNGFHLTETSGDSPNATTSPEA